METTEGCSRHLGEFIQSHCSNCDELLCLKCLAKGKHNGHNIVDYRSYLSKRQRDAENLLRRLRSLQQRAEHHNSIVTRYREDFNNCYGKSMKNLESFEEVKAGMLRWKKGLIAELEKKKRQQLQNLNTAICNSESNLDELVIKLPKVTVLVSARNNLHRKVTELTPNPVNDFYKLTKRHHIHHSNSFSHRSTTSSVVSDYTYMHAISPSPSESVISRSSEDLLQFTTTGGKHHDSDQSDTETYISAHSSLSAGDLQSESIDISQGTGSFNPELPLKIPQETGTIPRYNHLNRKDGRIQSISQDASANYEMVYPPGSYAQNTPTSTNILESMIPNVIGDLTSENIELGPTDEEDVYEDTATPPHQEETCTTEDTQIQADSKETIYENPYDVNPYEVPDLKQGATPYQTLPPYVKVPYQLPIVSQSDTRKRFGSMATYEISQASEIIRPANIIIGSFDLKR